MKAQRARHAGFTFVVPAAHLPPAWAGLPRTGMPLLIGTHLQPVQQPVFWSCGHPTASRREHKRLHCMRWGVDRCGRRGSATIYPDNSVVIIRILSYQHPPDFHPAVEDVR